MMNNQLNKRPSKESNSQPRGQVNNQPSNLKIGRPALKSQDVLFKKAFQKHKTRYQLEAQLLIMVYNTFHHWQLQRTGQSSRTTNEQLREVFVYYKRIDIFEVLNQNNQKYFVQMHQLSEKEQEQYSSMVDLGYLYKVIKEWKKSAPLDNFEVFLPLIFHLHNERLLCDKFLCYFTPKIQRGNLLNMMFEGPSLYSDDFCLMTAALLLEVFDSQGIYLQRPRINATRNRPMVPFPTGNQMHSAHRGSQNEIGQNITNYRPYPMQMPPMPPMPPMFMPPMFSMPFNNMNEMMSSAMMNHPPMYGQSFPQMYPLHQNQFPLPFYEEGDKTQSSMSDNFNFNEPEQIEISEDTVRQPGQNESQEKNQQDKNQEQCFEPIGYSNLLANESQKNPKNPQNQLIPHSSHPKNQEDQEDSQDQQQKMPKAQRTHKIQKRKSPKAAVQKKSKSKSVPIHNKK